VLARVASVFDHEEDDGQQRWCLHQPGRQRERDGQGGMAGPFGQHRPQQQRQHRRFEVTRGQCCRQQQRVHRQ